MALIKKIQEKMNDQKRIEFAKQLEDFYQSSHADVRKIMTQAFLKGIATGLGVFLGGTIVVGLLLWALSGLSNLPFVGDISKAAEHSIQETPVK
ncbi:MAG: DUF5665 domain-containing protein [Candidatus Saccharimonadales bacterium]